MLGIHGGCKIIIGGWPIGGGWRIEYVGIARKDLGRLTHEFSMKSKATKKYSHNVSDYETAFMSVSK